MAALDEDKRPEEKQQRGMSRGETGRWAKPEEAGDERKKKKKERAGNGGQN